MTDARLFLCFDSDRDDDLRALFLRQFLPPLSGFRVVDWSREGEPRSGWEGELRGRLSDVDVVVVLCSESTHDSANVGREFAAAKEQEKPYVLLWARRAGSCTRPASASAHDHFYAWSQITVTEQVEHAIRHKLDPDGIERAIQLGLRTRPV